MKQMIHSILTRAHDLKASDVHLSANRPPIFRIHGKLRQNEAIPLTEQELILSMKDIMGKELSHQFETLGEVDFSYELENISRFRLNVYKKRGGVSAAIRLIPNQIPSIDELYLPPILKRVAEKSQGLVLVTGPTGSGKSTTLAAMIDFINRTEAKHIITLEDPIEYVHENIQCIIDQREIGTDTRKFSTGLRAALRQDPDVILVGELRDLETIVTAISAAETGHLVFGTLHTMSAPATIERIVDVFPANQQEQIRYQLATVLVSIISQRLFPLQNGRGRIAALEILMNNHSVSNLIRNQKLHQLRNVIQTSREQGMQTMQMHVKQLMKEQLVSYEAIRRVLEENGHATI
ncbi:type IV pilus twitching motility protein PilT [Bacillus sp. FJAT-47783]|uniref:type IV pilus twitching motility protein PilT n=1 Tax=Bacillus sp. FJAT-47783 TaxID=2922712 RepID=UPI001FAC320D|nr:type IV pilus twitching motility protein PilT [Bacillus sp. FJAT-47783]